MKKLAITGLLLLVLLNMLFAAMDYTMLDPLSLPTYTGPLSSPEVKIVYEDANGEYILVEIDGQLHVFYL
ncbi:MAG: hypothetical protein PHT37_06925 [Candidatus Cloacimonetes bacterium]|jgi:hypothetical protein|nr:hypothetical protein [Candidatus Cloacimonadota bacterium]MDD3563511.1 hypothetical protein [Candidatus Cloacimonadota bacterium]MDD4277600.1 hypothetical protein [Candidatus Cloacimonadota bacterium]MDY0326491.1 hypothetical protein [Candidatus Cloacimonadaceae bacterium]